MDKEKERAMVL